MNASLAAEPDAQSSSILWKPSAISQAYRSGQRDLEFLGTLLRSVSRTVPVDDVLESLFMSVQLKVINLALPSKFLFEG
jgi:hypothetical protein